MNKSLKKPPIAFPTPTTPSPNDFTSEIRASGSALIISHTIFAMAGSKASRSGPIFLTRVLNKYVPAGKYKSYCDVFVDINHHYGNPLDHQNNCEVLIREINDTAIIPVNKTKINSNIKY